MPELFYSIGFVILVLLSSFFSASETAYSSIPRVRFKNLSDSKSVRVQWMAALGEHYDKMLTTILVGNNIANIAAASIATILFAKVLNGQGTAASLSTLVTTIIILFVGEVGPKTLAKKNPESVALAAAPAILFLYYLFYPLNYILGLWQKLLFKLFKKSENNEHITDEELITYVDEAEDTGGIDAYEGELLRSAIEFDDLTVEDALTPRVNMVAIDISLSMDKVSDLFKETNFSRLPVYRKTIDNVVGILNEKDFYKGYLSGETKIRNIMSKEVILVPSTTKLPDLLRKLQKGKSHMAIVIDEFGGVMGLITLEDILEELVGEIWDEHDEVVEKIKQISEDNWEIVGDVGLDEIFEMFDIEADDEDYDTVTLSGFISTLLERVPQIDDEVRFENLIMKVEEVEFNRASLVTIKVLPKENDEDNNSLLLRGLVGKDNEEDNQVED